MGEAAAGAFAKAQSAKKVWTIVRIGLFAGTLDITENLIFNQLRGVTPKMVFQFIASGLIDGRSFTMGDASVVLGVVIHYCIALFWTFVFYLLSRKLRFLLRSAAIWGVVYGGVVYVLMNFLVLPLTCVPHAPKAMTIPSRISGVLALLFCIGFTVAMLVSRFTPPLEAAEAKTSRG